jgi:hypothetical protein
MDDCAQTSAAVKSIEGIPDGAHLERRDEDLVLVGADGEVIKRHTVDRSERQVR